MCWRSTTAMSPGRSMSSATMPTLEVRNKPEGPKSESQNQAASRRFEPWNFRILNLFRVRDFGFRICRASNCGRPDVRIPPESRILFLHRHLAPHSKKTTCRHNLNKNTRNLMAQPLSNGHTNTQYPASELEPSWFPSSRLRQASRSRGTI